MKPLFLTAGEVEKIIKFGGAEQLPLLVKSDIGECVKVVCGAQEMASSKVELDLKGVVLKSKLEGLEVDLKGEAQVVAYLPGLT